MKKTMWKWKAVLTLLVCMIAVGGNWSGCKVQAERIDKATGLRYEIVDDAKITITGYSGETTTVQIPAKIDGMEVTGIGKEAFWNCDSLTSITIPNSVTSIGEEAFRDCDSLTSITIPNSVTSIGEYAFRDTPLLEAQRTKREDKLVIVNDILIEGENAEGDITIPNGVRIIGDHAFYDCENLTSITIPDSVTSIGGLAFAYCHKLTSITGMSGVTSIGMSAFIETPWLEAKRTEATQAKEETNSLVILNDILIDGKNAEGDITIPDSVTSIMDFAFSYCSGLTSITIPNSVTSIGKGVFESCSSLTSITIPDSVTSIGKWAFESCSSLTSITIPSNVTSIGDSAFELCSKLTSIKIPDSVRSIGEAAFYDCKALTDITGMKGVTSIRRAAFSNTSWLDTERTKREDKLVIVNNILIDGHKAEGKITIPDSVTSIGEYAFDECSELTDITGMKGVTSIEDFAFEKCGSLKDITIPDNVRSIGNSAFSECSKLTNITGMKGVTSIGRCAFSFCESLTSIIIPNNVTSIGWGVFNYCSEKLVIYTTADSEACKYAWEEGITVMDMDKNLLVPPVVPENSTPTTPGGTAQDTKPVTTPTTEAPAQTNVPAAKKTPLTAEKEKAKVKVTSDNTANPTVEYVASTNKSAKTVKVPDSVTVGGVTYKVTSVKDKAFKGNKKVTSVTIGKNVTSIGKDAFKNCTSLKSVTIQSGSLAKIGTGAFSGNKKLVKITLKTTKLTKKSIGKNALKGTNKKLVIKVPKQQVKKYKKYFKGKGNTSVKVTK